MKPPAGYPTEPKAPGTLPPHASRCGWTWAKRIMVDGRLPNGFGAQYSHELPSVMPVASLGQIGWAGDVEAARRDTLQDAIARVGNQLELAATSLDATSVQSIAWLLKSAVAELDRAAAIHRKWNERPGGGFPLSLEDRVTNFRKACAGHMGRAIHEGPVELICPLLSELKTRPTDRTRIRQAFEDAATHVRCAEYWLWRVMLYRNALADWIATRPPAAGGGLAQRPAQPPEPLDLTRVPPPPLPPSRGTLINVPDAPPEVAGGVLKVPPQDPGLPPDFDPGPGPDRGDEPLPPSPTRSRTPSAKIALRVGAVGAVAVTVFLLAR